MNDIITVKEEHITSYVNRYYMIELVYFLRQHTEVYQRWIPSQYLISISTRSRKYLVYSCVCTGNCVIHFILCRTLSYKNNDRTENSFLVLCGLKFFSIHLVQSMNRKGQNSGNLLFVRKYAVYKAS